VRRSNAGAPSRAASACSCPSSAAATSSSHSAGASPAAVRSGSRAVRCRRARCDHHHSEQSDPTNRVTRRKRVTGSWPAPTWCAGPALSMQRPPAHNPDIRYKARPRQLRVSIMTRQTPHRRLRVLASGPMESLPVNHTPRLAPRFRRQPSFAPAPTIPLASGDPAVVIMPGAAQFAVHSTHSAAVLPARRICPRSAGGRGGVSR